MSAVNNGGPAFPVGEEALMRNLQGMTLRDYFAAKAMQSLLNDVLTQPKDWAVRNLPKLGETSYVLADAMLAAREAK